MKISVLFMAIIISLSCLVTVVMAAPQWQISTVDSVPGDVGGYNSMALDGSGNPRISYYDFGNGDLKYAKWTGSAWNISTVDSEGQVGMYTSLKLDSAGNPRISSTNYPNHDLKYAKWTGSAWDISIVKAGNVGESSLALDVSGNPRISYFDWTNQNLKYAKWTGSTWQLSDVDNDLGAGEHNSLALDVSGNPRISYINTASGDLKYANWTGSAWQLSTVDSSGFYKAENSLALTVSGNPCISYCDITNSKLKYAKWTGSGWDISTVDTANDVVANSLALDASGNPHISYYDYNNGTIKYAKWTGSAWDISTVDSAGIYYQSTSLMLDGSGKPHISYHDSINFVLKYAELVPTPAPVANFTATPLSGTAPLIVRFNDTSTNTPSGWAWFFGDENYTQAWTQVNASSGWSARQAHTSVVIPDGSIVLMGGYDGGYKNDTWRSMNNGATWTLVNASSGWLGRNGHSSVATPEGSIVLMGGYAGSYKNDTWRSTDKGVTWTQSPDAGWSARSGHSTVVMPDGSIVLMGGYDGGYLNDTWRSINNGTTWTRVNASSGWSARADHTSVSMPDGSIVLITGEGSDGVKNDTWRSKDKGATWTQMNASAGDSARFVHTSVAMPDGSIVLMGGWDGGGFPNEDTWRSTDNGATWTLVNTSARCMARGSHSSVAMPDGSIVLMGGRVKELMNDTWRFQPAGASAQSPSHTYTMPGIYQVALQVYNAIGYNSTRKTGYITVSNPGVLPNRIGVFRPSTHLFYLDTNGNGVWNGASVDKQYTFGLTADIPVTGDWNSDGKTDIGVFRNSTHLFYLDYNGNGAWNGASVDRLYNFGITGDIPLTGDWNNNGKYEIGVFRPSTHLFYLDYNGNGAWNGASVDKSYNFGITGDIPISGDWNNNGISEIGVFRPSTHLFYLDYNGNGVWNGASVDRSYNFGITGDKPIAGKWN